MRSKFMTRGRVLKRILNKKKITTTFLAVIVLVLVELSFLPVEYSLTIEVADPPGNDVIQVFYDLGSGFNEADSKSITIRAIPGSVRDSATSYIRFPLPAKKIKGIRIDPGTGPKVWNLKSMILQNKLAGFALRSHTWLPEDIARDFAPLHAIDTFSVRNKKLLLNVSGSDPYFGYKDDFRKVHKPLWKTARHFKVTVWGITAFFAFFWVLLGGRKILEILSPKIYITETPKKITAVDFILWLALLITVIGVFVPFSPAMPAAGLDSSWVFGMNQATAQGLSFGREIIFTFGPYASIYTKAYHPSTDFMMISGSLYLALLYWACLVFLMRGVQWRWVLAFCAILAGVMRSRDALLFSLPLLVGLLIFKILFLEEGRLVKSRFALLYVALLCAPFGLLPLIKGSILISCGAVAVLCAALFIANRHRLLAVMCLISPMVSMFFFWIASGQAATTLPQYFIGIAPIVSGYTEAMALNGNPLEVVLYLITSAILLSVISVQTQIIRTSRIFLFCTYFVFLFLSFKAGFVRHDGHAVISGTSILIAALLLPFILNTRIILPVIAFALLTWSCIDSHYIKTSPESLAKNVNSIYLSMWHGIKNRIENKNWPRLDFDAAVNSLREEASFPVLQGTTDIYSYNQSYLISSGNSWSPRPILQSYSVYTPALAQINRRHLLGGQAPDNIIFRVEPIDERIPSIEDGASWPILMRNYRPTGTKNDFLFLKKNESAVEIAEPSELTTEKHVFGESVHLPQSSQPLFVQIEIKPTILGRIASVLFKPNRLQITLELNNGMKKKYRIVAGMAKSGFLISPLIENTAEFGMLYGKNSYLDEKLVKSFSIGSRHGRTMFWNDVYTVTFSQMGTISSGSIPRLAAKF